MAASSGIQTSMERLLGTGRHRLVCFLSIAVRCYPLKMCPRDTGRKISFTRSLMRELPQAVPKTHRCIVLKIQCPAPRWRSFWGKLYMAAALPPPPVTGIFDDVPASHWAADWIEQAYVDGITNGCNTNLPLYCPDDDVNRSQIAVLLLRGKHGGSYKPPADWHIYRCANKSLGGRLD